MARYSRFIFLLNLLFCLQIYAKETHVLLLDNGLRVYVQSDPLYKKAAASLVVQAGSWDDPEAFPGMAHFVEHLLFLGTTSFPIPSDMLAYTRDRGGECNAVTLKDRTVYGFSIHPHFLQEALLRFGEFFASPLLLQSAIEKERHVLQHEFDDMLDHSFSRVWRILKETGPDHPNRQLSCGNLHSLSHAQREDVHMWFQKYYRVDRMRLVLMGPQSVEELCHLAQETFSSIPRATTVFSATEYASEHAGSLLSVRQKGHFIYVSPVWSERVLSLCWEMPDHLSKKEYFLSGGRAFFHQYYAQRLRLFLQEAGLALDVQIDLRRVSERHGLLYINIPLTQEGLLAKERVIWACFERLHALQDAKVLEKFVREMTMPYRMHGQEYQIAMSIAEDLLDETKVDGTKEEMYCWLECIVRGLMAQEGVYFVVGPLHESHVAISHVERWMKAGYHVRKVPHILLDMWDQALLEPLEQNSVWSGSLPSFSLQPTTENPIFLINRPGVRIRWIDHFRGEHNIEAFFCLETPWMHVSAAYAGLYALLAHAVESSLQKVWHDKNVDVHMTFEENMLCIFLKTPTQYIKEIYEQLFQCLSQKELTQEQFYEAKSVFLDLDPGDPESIEYAHEVFRMALRGPHFTSMELYRAVQSLSYEDWRRFQPHCWERMFLEGTFLGSIATEDADMLAVLIQESFEPYEPFCPPEDEARLLQGQVLHLETHRHTQALLLALPVSHATNTFEHALWPYVTEVLLTNAFFQALRTEEHMAYKIYVHLEEVQGKAYYCFCVQSGTYSTQELLERTMIFLQEFVQHLSVWIPKERFIEMTHALCAFLQEEPDVTEEAYEKFLEYVQRTLESPSDKAMSILIQGCHELIEMVK